MHILCMYVYMCVSRRHLPPLCPLSPASHVRQPAETWTCRACWAVQPAIARQRGYIFRASLAGRAGEAKRRTKRRLRHLGHVMAALGGRVLRVLRPHNVARHAPDLPARMRATRRD